MRVVLDDQRDGSPLVYMRFHVSLRDLGSQNTRLKLDAWHFYDNTRQREPVPDKKQFPRASRFVAMVCQIDRAGKPSRGTRPPAQAKTSLSPIIKQFAGIRGPKGASCIPLSGARLAINIAHEGRKILRASGGHGVDGVGVRRNEWAGWAHARGLSGAG